MVNKKTASWLFVAVIAVLSLAQTVSSSGGRCEERDGRLNIDFQEFGENSPEVKAALEKEKLVDTIRQCIIFDFNYTVVEEVTVSGTTYRCTGSIPVSYCVSRSCFSSHYYHPFNGHIYKNCRCCQARATSVEKKIQLDCGEDGPCVFYTYFYTKIASCNCLPCPYGIPTKG